MSNVVEFRKREDPHIAGEALCVGCGHKWAAVAPVGTAWLSCPGCGSERGTWKYAVGAQPGDLLFQCLCGGEALTAYQRHGRFWLRCMGCGVDQTSAVFGEASS